MYDAVQSAVENRHRHRHRHKIFKGVDRHISRRLIKEKSVDHDR